MSRALQASRYPIPQQQHRSELSETCHMRFTLWNRRGGQAKPFIWTENMYVLEHARSGTDSVIRLLCLRVHCLALLPHGKTRPAPASQWLSHGPQRSRGSVGLCHSQLPMKGTWSGSCKSEMWTCLGLGRHSIRKEFLQLPSLLPRHHIWSDFAFLLVTSISLSGLHIAMELVKPFSHLNTALGGLGPYCSMGAVYRHSLLFTDLFLRLFFC